MQLETRIMMSLNYKHRFARLLIAVVAPLVLFQCSREKGKSIDYLGQKPPGDTAQLFAPGLITTDSYEHSAPAFSPDGKVVLWTVVDKSYRASMMEMSYDDGKWSSPYRPSFADSTADDYYPSFSPDGKKLYFSSRRNVPSGYPEGKGIRIWQVDRTESRWGNPSPFDTTVSKGENYAHSITKNGTLYFSTSIGGATSWSLQKSEKVNGSHTKPTLLPYSINNVDYEDGPFVSPDESFLIFDSQRPDAIDGGIDLFISFKDKDNGWTIPVNMGPKINSKAAERFAKLSPDGKYLFFGSNRNMSDTNWGFDIYWIDAKVIDDLRNHESAQHSIELPLGNEIIDALYKNDTESAGTKLSQWLTSNPGSLNATVTYSSILRKSKEYLSAEKLLTTSLMQWNNNTSIIMEMSLVKFAVNKDDEAIELIRPILEGDQLRERYLYLSRSLLDMGMFTRSDDYFEKAMTISPASYPYFNRGCSYARIGEKTRAFEALNKAVVLGHTTKKEYEDNPALKSLKSDSRWRVLMEKMK